MNEGFIVVGAFLVILILALIIGTSMVGSEEVTVKYSNSETGFTAWKLSNGTVVYEDYSTKPSEP